jgi:hypothetical protein
LALDGLGTCDDRVSGLGHRILERFGITVLDFCSAAEGRNHGCRQSSDVDGFLHDGHIKSDKPPVLCGRRFRSKRGCAATAAQLVRAQRLTKMVFDKAIDKLTRRLHFCTMASTGSWCIAQARKRRAPEIKR